MLDITRSQLSSHWVPYSAADRDHASISLRIDKFIVLQIERHLQLSNPDVQMFQ